MKVSATKLRQNLYRLLDDVIETGIPIEIERKGQILKIISEHPKKKLANLETHHIINGDPGDLVNIQFTDNWNEGKNL